MDLETIYHAEGSSLAEVEALEVKSLLESNGIPAVLVGDSILPNLPLEVKVSHCDAARARQLIARAEEESWPAEKLRLRLTVNLQLLQGEPSVSQCNLNLSELG